MMIKKYLTLFNILAIVTVAIGSFLRFFNPLWDNGLFLHPDERLFINASGLTLPVSISQFFSPNSPLNPHMFYYGSFLLYLYKAVSLISPFSLLMTSRLISAFFSALTIGLVFATGNQLFSKKVGLISSIIFAFAAGSIQYAHFNTTESALIFFLAAVTYTDILSVKKKKPQLVVVSLIIIGISVATKITGLLYLISPLIASVLLYKEKIPWIKIICWLGIGSAMGALVCFLCAPYQLIDATNFVSQQSYMQAVTYGIFKPPFVIIYNNTVPYLYQFFHVFPFAFGFVSFPLALFGFCMLIEKISTEWRKHTLLLFLFVFPLIYFAWAGTWYAKFARYYLLLLPFLSLWAGYCLSKMKKFFMIFFILCISANGLLFMRIYLSPHTRISASEWIYAYIPHQAAIATEHWDDMLPLILPNRPIDHSYKSITLTVYDPDSPTKIRSLAQNVSSSDYIILSSRRVYVSILDNPSLYPQTINFYKKLFSGELGFQKVYQATSYPFFFSDSYADETFQSYDHPPVVIFKNIKHISTSQIYTDITSF